jgi:teichuronic acid exporter
MLRSVLTIMKGSALAQLAGILILPILSRSFSPEVFGHFQAYQAIMTMFIVVVMLRYEVAILRAEDGPELTHLLSLCFLLIVLTTVIFSMLLISALIIGWPKFFAELGFGWWWLALSGLIIGWTQIFGYLATRGAAYELIAKSKVAQGFANAGISAGLAVTIPINSGLIVADLAGRLANGFWLARGRVHLLRGIFNTKWADLLAVASSFRDLSLVSLPGAILSTASSIMTPLLIYTSFTASTAGQFGLVDRALALPVALIVGAVSQVHMGNLSADIRAGTGDARKNFRRLSSLLAGLALAPAITCVLFAPALFNLVFGPGWNQAANFARILAPAYFFILVSGGINMTLTIMGRQKTQLAWDVSRFVAISLLSFHAVRVNWPVEWIIASYSALLCLFSIAQMFLCYQALPRSDGDIRKGMPTR